MSELGQGLVECVPNFSEGRRREVIDALVAEVRSVPGVSLLDVQLDADHNRSVLTLAGHHGPVAEAAFAAARRAAALIDMERHQGSHPRIGATDVIPFVPLGGTSLEECVALARGLGQRIAMELGIPVYLYGAAATRPERISLADVRKGQYEGLKADIARPERQPDFGPPATHPTAGATAVGARWPMVAFNVYLQDADLALARAIARRVRERNGGLPRVQAIALEVQGGELQVSMNLLDTATTSLWRAFSEVRRLALEAGARVSRSEVVGLLPSGALLGSLNEALLASIHAGQVLESRLAGIGGEGPR